MGRRGDAHHCGRSWSGLLSQAAEESLSLLLGSRWVNQFRSVVCSCVSVALCAATQAVVPKARSLERFQKLAFQWELTFRSVVQERGHACDEGVIRYVAVLLQPN